MKAPDKIFVPTRLRLVDGLRVRESDTDEEYIRKDTLLEWLEEKKSDSEKIINKTQSEVWKAANSGRLDIILSLIDKLNSM